MPRMIADLERAGGGWRSLNLTGADVTHGREEALAGWDRTIAMSSAHVARRGTTSELRQVASTL